MKWLFVGFCLPIALSAMTLKTFTDAVQASYPQADNMKRQSIYLTQQQVATARTISGVNVDSAFVVVYKITRQNQLLGWVYLDTHRVRTLNETLFVSIAPDDRVHDLQVLSFSEPQEYMATARYLALFKNHELNNKLSTRGDIPSIAGSSLTSTATVNAVRRTLAIHLTIRGQLQ